MNAYISRTIIVLNAFESLRSHRKLSRRWLALVVLVLGLSLGVASNAAAQFKT